MKFILRKTSDYDWKYGEKVKKIIDVYPNSKEINIEKIEELIKLHFETKQELIIGYDKELNYLYIEIYDDWRE